MAWVESAMWRACAGVAMAVALCTAGFAQPAGRAFEVASVKAHEGPLYREGVYTEGIRLEGVDTVLGYIMYAYNLKWRQVSLPPAAEAAVDSSFYDVAAKAESGRLPAKDEFREMLQTLLAERVQLRVHHEQHEMPVYALVVGRNGPKFKASAPDAGATAQLHVAGRNYQIVLPQGTMADLVGMIENSGFLGRSVLDRTGLAGTYDLKLVYTPDIRPNRENPDPGDINILQAVEEQLGLKLEPLKAVMDVLVVDHVEKPTAN
jgi:uncharacterized protein (TIGR03435 family)